MSVLKRNRKESRVQFMQTALDLSVTTIDICKKFPKSLTFYVSIPTVTAAKKVYSSLKRGNRRIPTNQEQLKKRLNYFEEAQDWLQELSSEMDIAYAFQHDNIAEGNCVRWFTLLDDAINLVNAQIKNDKARFKDLPL